MTPSEERFDKLLQSNAVAVVIAVVALTSMFVATDIVRPFPSLGNHGIVLPSPNLWFGDAPSDTMRLMADITALALQIVVVGLLLMSNHIYKVIRSPRLTYLSIFLVLQAMTPGIATEITSGPPVAVILLIGLMTQMAAYNRPKKTIQVYLAFTLVSAGAMFQMAFLPYLAAMFLSLALLRIFRIKAMIASILGMVTPWWVLWCFGIDIPRPEWHFAGEFFNIMHGAQLWHFVIAVAVSIIAGAGMTAANFIRIINTNSRSRSINGVLMLMGFLTTALIFVDCGNSVAYITMLNLFTAIQTGHFMHIYQGKRICYLSVALLLTTAFALYVWALWI